MCLSGPSLTKGQRSLGSLDAQIDDPDFQVFQGFCRCFFYGGSLGLMLVLWLFGMALGSQGMMGLGWKGIAVQKNAQTRKCG